MLIHVVFSFSLLTMMSCFFFFSVNDDMNKNKVYSKTGYEWNNIGYI